VTWHRPAGTLTGGPDPIRLDPDRAGWAYSGLHVLELGPGESRTLELPADEAVVVPLKGSFTVTSEVMDVDLEGRSTVFGDLTDRVYLPTGVGFTVSSSEGGEVAVATARAEGPGETAYLSASETSVELRGAGQASRQINGLWTADVPGPQRLIVVEVLTPAGNWSSFPPHKHDEMRDGEVPLEEIYYFRIEGESGFGFHRTYTADRHHDETVTVGDGDVYLIPRGYHGPCVAAPGHDMYYLNVMAGPARDWLIYNDPEHDWILGEWEGLELDPRLPLNREEAR
jgi:5-deoxy-glucuronate isomerase